MNFFKQLLSNKKAVIGLWVLGFFVVMSTIGPFLVRDPTEFLTDPIVPPNGDYLLGSTQKGQDVLAQTVVGARTSLIIGFVVGITVVFIGALVGIAAGFMGGWVDDVLSLLTNVFLIIPGLPLAVVLAAYMEASPRSIAIVLILTGWAWNARVLRAQTLSIAKKDFVQAAVVGGESRLRIMFVEILPNMTSLVVSGFIGAVVYAIGAQVGLEFLGLGDLSSVTWGTNLFWAANSQALLTESWWVFVPTGLCVAAIGFGLVMINFAIDEVTNPRLHSEGSFNRVLAQAGVIPGFSTPVVQMRDPEPEGPNEDLGPDSDEQAEIERQKAALMEPEVEEDTK
jgi:peptide/nickel transport system permease protein